MNALGLFVLLGVPGLVLGGVLGFVIGLRKFLAIVFVAAAIAFAVAITNPPEGSPEDDDDPVVFVFAAMITNFVGFEIGLVIGALTRRASSRRSGPG